MFGEFYFNFKTVYNSRMPHKQEQPSHANNTVLYTKF